MGLQEGLILLEERILLFATELASSPEAFITDYPGVFFSCGNTATVSGEVSGKIGLEILKLTFPSTSLIGLFCLK